MLSYRMYVDSVAAVAEVMEATIATNLNDGGLEETFALRNVSSDLPKKGGIAYTLSARFHCRLP